MAFLCDIGYVIIKNSNKLLKFENVQQARCVCTNSSLERSNSVYRNQGDPKKFPYIAHIGYPELPIDQFCAGAIIHRRWILKTAGCKIISFQPVQSSTIIVGIGLKRNEIGKRYAIERIVVNVPSESFSGQRLR